VPCHICTRSDGQTSNIYGPNGLPIEQINAEEAPTYYHHDQLKHQ